MFAMGLLALCPLVLCYYFGKSEYEKVALRKLVILLEALPEAERKGLVIVNLEKFGLKLVPTTSDEATAENIKETGTTVPNDSATGPASLTPSATKGANLA